jgi:hypothetical protein
MAAGTGGVAARSARAGGLGRARACSGARRRAVAAIERHRARHGVARAGRHRSAHDDGGCVRRAGSRRGNAPSQNCAGTPFATGEPVDPAAAWQRTRRTDQPAEGLTRRAIPPADARDLFKSIVPPSRRFRPRWHRCSVRAASMCALALLAAAQRPSWTRGTRFSCSSSAVQVARPCDSPCVCRSTVRSHLVRGRKRRRCRAREARKQFSGTIPAAWSLAVAAPLWTCAPIAPGRACGWDAVARCVARADAALV